jgi:Hemerythrin HHE cation binding domain
MTAPTSDFDRTPETARGRALYQLLLTVHAHIRRDLETVAQLAADVRDGLAADRTREQLHELRRGGMLWQLQVGCLRYCSFVHLHHRLEDRDFFGALLDANPAIAPVVERLQAEHRRVSDDLDAVEAAALALEHDDGRRARGAVVDALLALERNLLAHLEYEELSVESTVRRLRALP